MYLLALIVMTLFDGICHVTRFEDALIARGNIRQRIDTAGAFSAMFACVLFRRRTIAVCASCEVLRISVGHGFSLSESRLGLTYKGRIAEHSKRVKRYFDAD